MQLQPLREFPTNDVTTLSTSRPEGGYSLCPLVEAAEGIQP